MSRKRKRCIRGVSLVEVLVATVVISIATVGALSYESYAARQARMAYAQAAAVRIAHLLLQDWKANAGSVFYASGSIATVPNPLDLDMDFSREGGGVYRTTVDGIPMQVQLSRQYPQPGRVIPITAKVQWKRDFTDGQFLADDPSVEFTAYVRADQTDG